jgi:hypothetical protein
MATGWRSSNTDEGVAAAVRLTSFDVRGFRSLADIAAIPVSEPTILAGHNDGGKSAVIDALRFLLGSYQLTDDDRTYVDPSKGADDSGERCGLTEVQGRFELDHWEQEQWMLPGSVTLRRRSLAGGQGHLELLASVPEDERLRSPVSLLVPELRTLVSEYGLEPSGSLKADLVSAVTNYAKLHATTTAWIPVPPEMVRRLPQVLVFGGAEEKPDAAVRTALMGRFNEYINDPALRGKLSEIEAEIEGRLRIDAKELCEHIQSRCDDLGEVTVAPQVSFRHGFVGAPLGIARTSGQPVSLERSGQGSNRRILLAVWEWTSKLLRQDEAVAAADTVSEAGSESRGEILSLAPLTQTIVIYDEPDTHLDYGHQRRIMRLIRDQCELTHVNVVVATHSMNLIDGVDIADVVHLRLDAGRTVVERLADDAHEVIDGHLGAIAASVGLRNSVLLHERCFLAVEGPSEQQAFPLLFRLAEGIALQSAGIALWACGGNDGALNLAKYLVEHHRTVVLAIDGDSASKKLFKQAHLTNVFGARMNELVEFIGKETNEQELEATFSDEVWAKVANKIWPKKEGPWSESAFRELRTSGKFSEKVHSLLREGSESGPSGKASMMAELAAYLTDRTDIPDTLLSLFSRLRALAD